MKKFITVLFLSCFIISVAKAQEIKNYSLEVGQFDKVRVLDNVNVVYRCLPDSTGYIQYSGKADFADAFIITAKGDGKLKIQVTTEDVGKPDLPTLFIYSDFLTSVENSSDFLLKVESVAPCAELKMTQIGNGMISAENISATKVLATLNTGNGTVNVSGKCETAVLKMVGAGMIAADRLRANDVQCRILGTGSIGCWPVATLSVKGIGSTKIYYKGDPMIKKSGGGKLFELPDDGNFGSETWIKAEEENLKAYDEDKAKENEQLLEEEEEDEEPQTVVTWGDD